MLMVLDLLYVALVCEDTEKQHGGTSHVLLLTRDA